MLGIGKIRERWVREAASEYAARVGHYAPISVLEVPKEATGSERDLDTAYQRVKKEHQKADVRVALDSGGRSMTSEDLAGWLEDLMVRGVNLISFLIGGPHGLPGSALADSGQSLSLGGMTLTHQMARIVLLEQLYRAFTIIRGEPYHK